VNFSQFLDPMHISTLNCDEMAGDRQSDQLSGKPGNVREF